MPVLTSEAQAFQERVCKLEIAQNVPRRTCKLKVDLVAPGPHKALAFIQHCGRF